MGSLRTKESQQKYKDLIAKGHLSIGCKLCEDKSLKEFTHWRIITNLFPFDLIAKTHHMIIPKRHITYNELTEVEKQELELIKTTLLGEEYEFMIENLSKMKSIPEHFHLHLVVTKD